MHNRLTHALERLYVSFFHLWMVFHRHRMFVGLPLFLIAVAVTVGASQSTARVVSLPQGAVHTAGKIMLSAEVQGVLSEGASVTRTEDVPRLTQGSLLLTGPGMVELDAGAVRLHGWSGGYSASVQGQTVTVAAITTPVLVSGVSGFVLVPERFQWKGQTAAASALKPLPPAFFGEKTALLRTLTDEAAQSLTGLPTDYVTFSVPLADLLRLPVSRARAKVREQGNELTSLASSLVRGNKGDLQKLLQQGAAAGLKLAPAKSIAPLLLHKAVKQRMTAWFLPAFLINTERWTLASIHPQLRDLAWTDPMTQTIPSEQLLPSLLALPQSDVQTEGASHLTIEAWGRAFSAYLTKQKNPAAAVRSLLPDITATIKRSNALGYPKRAQDYASALLDVLHALKDLPASLQPYLADLTALSDRTLPPASVLPLPSTSAASSAASASSSSPLPLLTPEEIHARAQQALQGVNALFTIKTVIEPLTNTNTARITGIALPTPRGEELMEFTYNVASDHVVGLTKDGKTLPYEVTLKQFVEWVKNGR